MKESATIALEYIKANAEEFEVDPQVLEKYNVHIHVPEGATPKDGPSAGITLATSVVSLLTNTPIKKEVAMTGEITLRGPVVAIVGRAEILSFVAGASCLLAYDFAVSRRHHCGATLVRSGCICAMPLTPI